MNTNTFTVYNQSTGEILRTITAPEEIVLLNVAVGEAYLPGDGNAATQVIVDGQIVSKPLDVLEEAKRQAHISLMLQTRQSLLMASDWTDTHSAPDRLGPELYEAWQVYRQALRDVPQQPGFPLDIVWPTPPQ